MYQQRLRGYQGDRHTPSSDNVPHAASNSVQWYNPSNVPKSGGVQFYNPSDLMQTTNTSGVGNQGWNQTAQLPTSQQWEGVTPQQPVGGSHSHHADPNNSSADSWNWGSDPQQQQMWNNQQMYGQQYQHPTVHQQYQAPQQQQYHQAANPAEYYHNYVQSNNQSNVVNNTTGGTDPWNWGTWDEAANQNDSWNWTANEPTDASNISYSAPEATTQNYAAMNSSQNTNMYSMTPEQQPVATETKVNNNEITPDQSQASQRNKISDFGTNQPNNVQAGMHYSVQRNNNTTDEHLSAESSVRSFDMGVSGSEHEGVHTLSASESGSSLCPVKSELELEENVASDSLISSVYTRSSDSCENQIDVVQTVETDTTDKSMSSEVVSENSEAHQLLQDYGKVEASGDNSVSAVSESDSGLLKSSIGEVPLKVEDRNLLPPFYSEVEDRNPLPPLYSDGGADNSHMQLHRQHPHAVREVEGTPDVDSSDTYVASSLEFQHHSTSNNDLSSNKSYSHHSSTSSLLASQEKIGLENIHQVLPVATPVMYPTKPPPLRPDLPIQSPDATSSKQRENPSEVRSQNVQYHFPAPENDVENKEIIPPELEQRSDKQEGTYANAPPVKTDPSTSLYPTQNVPVGEMNLGYPYQPGMLGGDMPMKVEQDLGYNVAHLSQGSGEVPKPSLQTSAKQNDIVQGSSAYKIGTAVLEERKPSREEGVNLETVPDNKEQPDIDSLTEQMSNLHQGSALPGSVPQDARLMPAPPTHWEHTMLGVSQPDNQEVAPRVGCDTSSDIQKERHKVHDVISTDRNQYLETGQLVEQQEHVQDRKYDNAEITADNVSRQTFVSSDFPPADANNQPELPLPPPGLHRMVPGESSSPETQTLPSSSEFRPIEPPLEPRVVTGVAEDEATPMITAPQSDDALLSGEPCSERSETIGSDNVDSYSQSTVRNSKGVDKNYDEHRGSDNSDDRRDRSYRDRRERNYDDESEIEKERGHRSDRRGRDYRNEERNRPKSAKGRDYYPRDDSPGRYRHDRSTYNWDKDQRYDPRYDSREYRRRYEDERKMRRKRYDVPSDGYDDDADSYYGDRNYEDRRDRTFREDWDKRIRGVRDNPERSQREEGDKPKENKDSRSRPTSRSGSIHEYRRSSSRGGESDTDVERHKERDQGDLYYHDNRYRRYHRQYPKRDPREQWDMYYRGYDYMYDPYHQYYNYKYAYGYYEELRRTNPEAYREWYARYVAQYDNYSEDRGSVHSGRSSVNDDLQREKYLSQFSSEVNSGSRAGSFYDYEQSYSLNGQSCIASYHLGDYDNRSGADTTGASIVEEPESTQRLTPEKFPTPHINGALTAQGKLIQVLPTNSLDGRTTTVQMLNIQDFLFNSSAVRDLQGFPGPLIKGETHKNSVIQFCHQKIKKAEEDTDLVDRDSCILLWRLLVLLLKQNGTVAGTDIAELLVENHEILKTGNAVVTDHQSVPTSPETSSGISTEASGNGNNVAKRSGTPTSTSGADTPNMPFNEGVVNSFSRLPEEEVTNRFREFLLFGNTKEALEWAMNRGLWGHALFLASKMDQRTHANVMMRFANGLKMNDPLQTLYQLMSGRQPAAVTSCADEKWSDWKPHLAMILSNTTQRPELDRKAVTTMGDTLAQRGRLYAAHFCYLMSQLEFGTYDDKQSKIVLIGSSHNLPFCKFASNEAIQCTEIYEYACQLADDDFLLPHFQSYKYLYATRLAEYGFPSEAVHYCEVISKKIAKNASLFNLSFIKQVHDLGDRLKYQDPLFTNAEGESAEMSDPAWLSNLKNVINNYSCERPIGSSPSNLTGSDGEVQGYAQQGTYQTDSLQPQAQYQDSMAYQQQWQQYYSQQQWPQQGSMDTSEGGAESTTDQHSQEAHLQQQNMYWQGDQWNQQPVANGADANFVGSSVAVAENENKENQVPNVGYEDGFSYSNATSTEQQKPLTEEYKPSPPAPSETKPKTSTVQDKKPAKKQPAKAASGSSWLGGLWSKLVLRPKNQAILPDDKNPSIVWDPDKKRWVNLDEDEEPVQSLPPPPKAANFQPGTPASQEPNIGQGETPGPALDAGNTSLGPKPAGGTNKYKLAPGRSMRANYVDVMNPGSTRANPSVPSSDLFPSLGTKQMPAVNLFVPAPVPTDENAITDFLTPSNSHEMQNPQHQQQSTETSELSRWSSESSLSREVQSYMMPRREVAKENMSTATGQDESFSTGGPVMYNPSQFSQSYGSKTGSLGRKRYPHKM